MMAVAITVMMVIMGNADKEMRVIFSNNKYDNDIFFFL